MRRALHSIGDVQLELSCEIGSYTDFYSGIYHATRVGTLLRPDNPLLPNYKWVPVGYHGRASSILVSGRPFPRPSGQIKPRDATVPVLSPTRRLDYELELGIVIGKPNALGEPISIERAEQHLFGLTLLNDWSARDIQAWEYQPLGPFLSKSFATTVSPWIVTLDALQPFRAAFARPECDPQPLPYLDSESNRAGGAFDIELEVWLQTASMRDRGEPPQQLSRSNARDAYWTAAQLIAHHTVNGCNLGTGDLLGSARSRVRDRRRVARCSSLRAAARLRCNCATAKRVHSSTMATRWCCAAIADGRDSGRSASANAALRCSPHIADMRSARIRIP
jgi:fumarylacetoacetase